MFFDIINFSLYLLGARETSGESLVKLSRLYFKNRASIGFLFFNGTTFLNHQFTFLFSGNSKVKFRRKLDFFSYVDTIFNDFYSSFRFFFIKNKPSLVLDASFFCSNIQLTNFITQSY